MLESTGAGEGQDDYAEQLDEQPYTREAVDIDITSYKDTIMAEEQSRAGMHGQFDSCGKGSANRFPECLPSQSSLRSVVDPANIYHVAERERPGPKSSSWLTDT